MYVPTAVSLPSARRLTCLRVKLALNVCAPDAPRRVATALGLGVPARRSLRVTRTESASKAVPPTVSPRLPILIDLRLNEVTA